MKLRDIQYYTPSEILARRRLRQIERAKERWERIVLLTLRSSKKEENS